MERSTLTTRPRPKRTLSSSIRQYRTVASRGNDAQANSSSTFYGTITTSDSAFNNITESPLGAISERQRLLGLRSEADGGEDRDTNDRIDYDDADHEAAFGNAQADSDGLFPPNCTWTGAGDMPAKADPFHISKCAVWTRIHE